MLLAGLFVFGFSVIGSIFNQSIMVMLFIVSIPGPLFGILIPIFIQSSFIRKLLFFLAATILYFLSFYFIGIRKDYGIYDSLRLISVSTLNFILLQLIFDAVFTVKISKKGTFIFPALYGIIAAILPAISLIIFAAFKTDQSAEKLMWCFFSLIYPSWYYLFAKHLVDSRKIGN